MGVVKNIIPAIASTNALISAACSVEAVKILSGCNNVIDNYMQYQGQSGVSVNTFSSERLESCIVCKLNIQQLQYSKASKLSELVDKIKGQNNLLRPSISLVNGEILYISHPESLEQMHRHKLDKSLDQLI